MPLLLPFRRADTRERLVQATVFPLTALLALGVLVPFLMMLALSFGDIDDWWNGRTWPDLRHLHSGRRLYVEYLATRYDYWPSMYAFNEVYGVDADDTATILGLADVPVPPGRWRARGEDGLAFLAGLPWFQFRPLFTGWFYYRGGSGHDLAAFTGLSEVAWKDWLRARYRTIDAVNAKFGQESLAFDYVKVPDVSDPAGEAPWVLDDPWTAEYTEFLVRGVPAGWRQPASGDRLWRAWLQTQPDLNDLPRLNAALRLGAASWADVRLPLTVPAGPARKPWERFVRATLSPWYLGLEVTPALEASWRGFLVRAHRSEAAVQAAYGRRASEIPLAAGAQAVTSATQYGDWAAFVRQAPAESIRLVTVEGAWREFLTRKYGTAAAAEAAWGVPVASLETAPFPQPEVDRLEFTRHRWRYTAEIVLKNYRRVVRLIVGATDALWNTARFALLFTLLSVAVNCGAAWILSRFPGGPLQMSLVIFLALAAFPIEAMAVPNFVLLRGTGLLNTVWALVLPTAVNGYYIYLLKSAFDAIPKSYVEEATLEGAGEWRLFWNVGVPLIRPMLAVVALYAFLWAYSNFMWSLIVGQARSEWTLPVLIFNMNGWASTPVLAAVMMLALLPPLVVIAFMHRTLQRSLALPKF